eukprot:scaffold34058_cov28-Tisochrysis_lutea.AAC.3
MTEGRRPPHVREDLPSPRRLLTRKQEERVSEQLVCRTPQVADLSMIFSMSSLAAASDSAASAVAARWVAERIHLRSSRRPSTTLPCRPGLSTEVRLPAPVRPQAAGRRDGRTARSKCQMREESYRRRAVVSERVHEERCAPAGAERRADLGEPGRPHAARMPRSTFERKKGGGGERERPSSRDGPPSCLAARLCSLAASGSPLLLPPSRSLPACRPPGVVKRRISCLPPSLLLSFSPTGRAGRRGKGKLADRASERARERERERDRRTPRGSLPSLSVFLSLFLSSRKRRKRGRMGGEMGDTTPAYITQYTGCGGWASSLLHPRLPLFSRPDPPTLSSLFLLLGGRLIGPPPHHGSLAPSKRYVIVCRAFITPKREGWWSVPAVSCPTLSLIRCWGAGLTQAEEST